jgi:hypothetical protein
MAKSSSGKTYINSETSVNPFLTFKRRMMTICRLKVMVHSPNLRVAMNWIVGAAVLALIGYLLDREIYFYEGAHLGPRLQASL